MRHISIGYFNTLQELFWRNGHQPDDENLSDLLLLFEYQQVRFIKNLRQ